MMKQLHTFDDIFDTQKTFRLLLDAMANPSRVVSIQEGVEKLYGSKPEMLTLAMTLLDKNTGFYTFGHTELDEQILLLTHAEKKTLEEADYVFVTEEGHLPEAFAKAKRGTLENPHTSATLIIGCSGERNVSCSISGPGVDGVATFQSPAVLEEAFRLRTEQAYEYPQGVDMIFVSPEGELFCIPRMVKKEEQ